MRILVPGAGSVARNLSNSLIPDAGVRARVRLDAARHDLRWFAVAVDLVGIVDVAVGADGGVEGETHPPGRLGLDHQPQAE
jgi:hypothetical protein